MANDLNAPRISSRIDGNARSSESGGAFDRLNLNDGIAGHFAATGSTKDMLDAINSANRAFASFNESLARNRGHRLQKTAAITKSWKADFFDEWGEEIGSPIRKAKFEFRKAHGMPRSAFCRHASARGWRDPFNEPLLNDEPYAPIVGTGDSGGRKGIEADSKHPPN